MTYPLPGNMTGFTDMFMYTNSVSDGIFGPGVMFAIYVICLMYMKMNGERIQAACMASGFITTLVGIMFLFMGIVTGGQLAVVIVITALSVLWQISDND